MHIAIKPPVATVVLLTLVTLVVLVVAPIASALPPQCEFSCTCNSRCTQVCAIGNWVVTCDFDQTCQDYCFAGAPAKNETLDLRSDETGSCDVAEPTPAPLETTLDLERPPAKASPNAVAPHAE